MEQDQTTRPREVGTAVTLIYITFGIGLLRAIMGGAPVLLTLVFIGIMYLFVFQIGKGRNWARITFLVLTILGLPFSVHSLTQTFTANPVSGLLEIGQIVMQIIALVFLFQRPASDWFREIKMKSLKKKVDDWEDASPRKPS